MKQSKVFYFIGIGGIGMSSLARFLLDQGHLVGGYDKTRSRLIDDLTKYGAQVTFEADESAIPLDFKGKHTEVIYTPAIPKNHKQLIYFKALGNSIKKRAQLLGELTKASRTLAVAGTHGKTTTTSILAHFFSSLDQEFTAFVGGILKQNETNLLSTGNQFALVEADEYDRSFLYLFPEIACITSTDADHLDIYQDSQNVYKAYEQFASQVKQHLVVEKKVDLNGTTYSISEQADFYCSNIITKGFGYQFNLHTPFKSYQGVYFNQLGLHNLSNAIGAFAMASLAGLDENQVINAMATFQGVERRLELIYKSKNRIFIDDYAHHPTEIKAVFDTLQSAYPNSKKCVIFQPHLFTRTRDFMIEFAQVLGQFDHVLLMPIYPAREKPIEGISSGLLAQKVKKFTSVEVVQRNKLRHLMRQRKEQIIVTLGAGDIALEVKSLTLELTHNDA